MSHLKKIAVFTSIRSEYGPLLPILKKIKADPDLELRLLVGGAHLLSEYGGSISNIVADGFSIAKLFPFICEEKRNDAEVQSMAELQKQMGEYLAFYKPDLMLILGDRFELLPVASSCLVMNIPIAHISGGDVTEGAIDNQIRHAVTKMAHLHFPATETYRQNLLKMGEEDWRICVAGEPGLDQIYQMDYLSKTTLYSELELDINTETILCTFHPETINNTITPEFVTQVLSALLDKSDYTIVITAANFDHGGNDINNAVEEFSKGNSKRICFIKNLGQQRYYSLLRHVSLVLGNSSGGLTEVQSFNIPVINVGKRQQGRLANKNVVNADPDPVKIIEAIRYALTNEFKIQYDKAVNIYGDGNATERILNFIKKTERSQDLLMKISIF